MNKKRPVKRQLALRTAASLLGLAVNGAFAATFCVEPSGAGGCATTIQAAVNSATTAGDVVLVKPGVYQENVIIATAGVLVQGSGKAILDPDYPNSGAGITVDADNVSLSNLTIQNGQAQGISITGHSGTTISKVSFKGADQCVAAAAGSDHTTVTDSTFFGCRGGTYSAIDITGNFASITNNAINRCANNCVGVTGDDALLEKNKIYSAFSADCIDITGNRPVVNKNSLNNCSGSGIGIDPNSASPAITGNDIFLTNAAAIWIGSNSTAALVTQNTLKNVYGGIWFGNGATDPVVTGNTVQASSYTGITANCSTCTGARVSANRVSDVTADEAGIIVNAANAGMTVENNKVSNVQDSGIGVSGTGVTVSGNKITGAGGTGGTACIKLAGSGHTVSLNKMSQCMSHGIYLSASGSTLSLNTVGTAASHGIYFDGNGDNNTLDGNVVQNVPGFGFRISNAATGNTLSANKALNTGRERLCNASSTTTINADNNFGTSVFPGLPDVGDTSDCPVGP